MVPASGRDLGAWLIARQWLMSFSEKITMTPLLFIGVTIILLVIIGFDEYVEQEGYEEVDTANCKKI